MASPLYELTKSHLFYEPLAKLQSKVERSWQTLIVSNVSAWIRRRGASALHLGQNSATTRPLGLPMARPLPCGSAGRAWRLQWVGGTKLGSQQQTHQLPHRQRQNAEHQMAQHLGMTAYAHMTTPKVVLEATIDALDA